MKTGMALLISALFITHVAIAAQPPSQQKKEKDLLQEKPNTEAPSSFKPKDYSFLYGMDGFSDKALETHFELYKKYVSNTNDLLSLLRNYAQKGEQKSLQASELRRRLGWEFDGMRLHEYYFENLGGDASPLSNNSLLYRAIEEEFGSFEKWKEEFIATGLMRGIGWSVLYLDPVSNRLINCWINEHDLGHLAGGTPILIMDVFEHAYMVDYGLDRMKYINAFFKNINWNVVQKRYKPTKAD